MTITKLVDDRHGKVPVAVWRWTFTTDAAGAASETTEHEVFGLVQRIVTVPDGVAPPTANWDLTLLDADGVDILGGSGLDRDTAGTGAKEQCVPEILLVATATKLTFTVANGGATKKGTVKLYLV